MYENLVDGLIWEEKFEITIENVNRCVWCTVRILDSLFLYSLPTLRVDRKTGNDSACIKRGNLGGFRPHLLKINTAVDEDIKC